MNNIFYFFVILLLYTSCDNIKALKKPDKSIDTIIDFTKVDVSPSFYTCKKLTDKAKTTCFRTEMKRQFSKYLSKFSFTTKKNINDTILITLLIDNKGNIQLTKFESSEFIQKEIPELNLKIKQVIDSLPQLYPAIKRGIPVATEYKLPIVINVE